MDRIQPTPSEKLLYSTVVIEARRDGKLIGFGTGFLMAFSIQNGRFNPAIVTNKHVIHGASEIDFVCHINDNGRPSGKLNKLKLYLVDSGIIDHRDPDIDLCVLTIGRVLHNSKLLGHEVFVQFLDCSMIPTADDWRYFDAIEDVVMIGSPYGLWDRKNNLPIVRKGLTATPLSSQFDGRHEFLIDIAVFEGSSGSPVFIHDRHGYFDRRRNTYVMGMPRTLLVGILRAGPVVCDSDSTDGADSPQENRSEMPLHLGNVLKSELLLYFEQELIRRSPNSMSL